MKVSVIVPVYKVEKYLDRCIKSLVNQTLRDIEIILVDDGSPDNCPKLCDQYACKDSRIRVVHKVNGGLSSARNAGLKVAAGEYIGFVDADDDVELTMYERMLVAAEKYKVDFVMSDYIRIAEGTSSLKTLEMRGGFYTKQDVRENIFPQLIMGERLEYGPLLSVCSCLYKSSFLNEHELLFDEQVRWSEDNIFSALVGYHCNSFYYLKEEGLYHYYQNPASITTSYRKGAWDNYCIMNKHLAAFFNKVHDYDFGRQLKLHLVFYACNSIGMELKLPYEQALRGISYILNSKELRIAFCNFTLPSVSVKFKIHLLLMKLRMPRLICWLYKKVMH